MKRPEFISYIKQTYFCREGLFTLDIDVLDSQDTQQYLVALQDKLKNLNIPDKLLSSISYDGKLCKKEYDSYYEENEPESIYCRYNVSIHMHELYDKIAFHLNKSFDSVDIYRLEDIQSGQGLYNNKLSRNLTTFEHQPAPHEDACIRDIFSQKEQSDYRRVWSFGFKNLEQLRNWLQISDLSQLENSGLCIKKISVPELFIVEGNKQLIFRKDYQISENIISSYPQIVARNVLK